MRLNNYSFKQGHLDNLLSQQIIEMVLGRSVKVYRHMMKNMVTSLIMEQRLEITHAKAKHLRKIGNRLIHYAKRAGRGQNSALNLIKGRVATQEAKEKLLKEIVPKVEGIPQNYIKIEKNIRQRRGDDAPMVYVTIRNSEKEEIVRMQKKDAQDKEGIVDSKSFCRRIWTEEKSHIESLIKSKPEMAEFLQKKLARVQFDLWALDKSRHEKRVNLVF